MERAPRVEQVYIIRSKLNRIPNNGSKTKRHKFYQVRPEEISVPKGHCEYRCKNTSFIS